MNSVALERHDLERVEIRQKPAIFLVMTGLHSRTCDCNDMSVVEYDGRGGREEEW